MRVIVFDARGPWALFKRPYALMSPVSYPVPPPPAVFGMVGAVVGLPRDQNLQRMGQGRARVAVRLLEPVRKLRAALNLVDTRSARYFNTRNPAAGVEGLAHSQIPHEFLKDVAYRLYFTHDDPDLLNELERRLVSGQAAYTPCLGLAQCIADVVHVGTHEARQRRGQSVPMHTAVARDPGVTVHHELHKRYVRYRVAAEMSPDRVVTRHLDLEVETTGRRMVTDCPGYWEVGGDNVCFL